ncbi:MULTISPECIES: hypothetical protein [unclassified Bradyrhizobium]|uniref:hypothetical protein n=1 Tax=unclassified Bradyrhizobium TaxID=2631580 RepID=UPI001FF9F7B1|nr:MULTISPECIES: hypothetical protein [unclassified Bradyrhizobium]MCK1536852.1 hypothetical protein [Bradyrhizobium sp. 176]MCK1560155.1 hypothetical protein [Bradyrhizobium sp. 171]MCK1693700.1 hypothetical protein [Bradyrhizobium sp. 144]
MAGEAHEGVVSFEPLTLGREAVMLGKVRVGEISPLDGSRHRACFRLSLPEASATSWRPANDVDDAKRLALIKINDWLNAAGLVPTGGVA